MRNISFAMTTAQIRDRSKTVTRRVGWAWLKPGTLLQPIVKGQGIPKGGKVEKIGGPIRVVAVSREPLNTLNSRTSRKAQIMELIREGFGAMSSEEFVAMFCKSHKCQPSDLVTRIEFEYVEAVAP